MSWFYTGSNIIIGLVLIIGLGWKIQW